jgi:cysteine desulfurase / selenocysteine lyase
VALDIENIRAQFPELQQDFRGRPLAYLDSAATTLKPQCVISALQKFYSQEYATIHRGAYLLSEKATKAYEDVRGKVKKFIGAQRNEEIIFTRGTTEAINLVANSYGQTFIGAGEVVLVSAMEHHSNIVPWQMLCERKGCELKVIPMDDRGVLDLQAYEQLLKTNKVALVCFNHVSNALGTINPVARMIQMAKNAGAKTLVDGAQSTAHLKVDVGAWGCDFFAFSGHKIYAPTGVGVLYGRHELLKAMPPWQGGGDMIHSVSFTKTTYAEPPARFEAGTPAIAEVIGMGVAIDWLLELGLDNINAAEHEMQRYALKKLAEVEGIKFIGTSPERAGAISFFLEKAHPHDIATIVDGHGVAIRAGHHCAQPVMDRMGVPATARASLGIYTLPKDIDQLVQALHQVNEIF